MRREETLADLVCEVQLSQINKVQSPQSAEGLSFSSLLPEVKAFVQKAILSLPVFSPLEPNIFSAPPFLALPSLSPVCQHAISFSRKHHMHSVFKSITFLPVSI